MGTNTYERDMAYYLKYRSPINAKCIKPADEESEEVLLCSRVVMTDEPECYCLAYINPDAKWRIGDCALSDHFLKTTYVDPKKSKVRVGQQKGRKKKNR